VRTDGAKIYGQLTGQPEIEIFPSSKTDFFYTVVDARISFIVDHNGKAFMMILYQGGAVMELPLVE
jgi:hypothetical protein